MKAVSIILGVLLALAVGAIFGRAQGVQAVSTVFANSCDKLGGFSVGSKVYTCERAKKEKKID